MQARGQAMQAAADATPSGMVSVLGLEIARRRGAGDRGARPLEHSKSRTISAPGTRCSPASAAAIERIEQTGRAKRGAPNDAAGGGGGVPHRSDEASRRETGRKSSAGISITAPAIPVWSNVDASPHTDPAEIRELLVRQVVSPVKWEETMRGLLAAGVERFYEIGPGRVLAGLLKRVNRKADIRNIPA